MCATKSKPIEFTRKALFSITHSEYLEMILKLKHCQVLSATHYYHVMKERSTILKQKGILCT